MWRTPQHAQAELPQMRPRLARQLALTDGTERSLMTANKATPKNIDEYIAGFPKDVQEVLEKVRATVRKAAPEAKETIKYQMPTFTLNGNLVYFAAFKKHIGFYPPVTAAVELKNELSAYEGPKNSLIFPFDRPIPYDLISRIVKFRVKENLEKAAAKRKNK
jgi:uncharacterized protein YdhG (YjbR/CyaY superfamily)